MNPTLSKLIKLVTWTLVAVVVLLAIAVTTLRITLPKLNHFQAEIHQWVNLSSGVEVEFGNLSGFWRNTRPSLLLENVNAVMRDGSPISVAASKVEVEFDLVQTVLQRQPVVADLTVHELALDLTAVDFFSDHDENLEGPPSPTDNNYIIEQLNQILLRQLDGFAILESQITYRGLDEQERRLDIERLRWQNHDRLHEAEGVVSVAGTSLNSLLVKGNFTDHGSIRDISGEFFVSAEHIEVTPWLKGFLAHDTGIEKGQVSFNGWLTLARNKPTDAYLELLPSELAWKQDGGHELLLESGILQLSPKEEGWVVSAHSIQARTDHHPWPELDIGFEWQPDKWALNVSQLDIESLSPLVKLFPIADETQSTLQQLQPAGLVEDVRLSMMSDIESLQYSATLSNGKLHQWGLLPGLHKLHVELSGNLSQARAHVSVIDDILPYGEVFQAPLNIRQAEVDLIWENHDTGWRLWADKVTAATPDLQVLGAFRLDFPDQQSPLLSFYGEADLYNAGETWRYLPTLALGRKLTDYLSTAIQAGKVNTAKLLWYGELADFPYRENNGMFQAWVGLKEAKFSFDTAWPPITDLQLDLLFQNDAMYLDSHQATLMDVQGKRITGRIPEMAEDGHIEIEARAIAEGAAVRDYMTASPLVDSVGAALTAIDISGPVSSEFQLHIPFDDREARAWGYADLKNNHVDIDAPPMTLETVSGRVEFDNDVVQASAIEAQLLEQSVAIDFYGENEGLGYAVGIDVVGDWDIRPLDPYIGDYWLGHLNGHAPWQTRVDIQLNDVGFTYQIDTIADLKWVASDLPYPLGKSTGESGKARLQASGNQESITARLQLPKLKYQTEIDIRPDTPTLNATYLLVGDGSFKMSPVAGHHARIRTDRFDLDNWIALSSRPEPTTTSKLSEMNTPKIPLPQKVDMDVKTLTLAGMEWDNVDFAARRKNLGWYMTLESQQANGEANYIEPYDLSVSLDKLHVYIPSLDAEYKDKSLFETEKEGQPLISEFDRSFHQLVPNMTVAIEDFWLQGYRVGKSNLDLQRQGDKLEWKRLSFRSGSNQIDMKGSWTLSDQLSHTQFDIKLKGDNNSDIMERFGVSTGIQRAPFEMSANIDWHGAPWSMRVSTLDGTVNTQLGKGVVSDVSGAARLLGLFSLDSIIRKMQLDFSDVFDKGMAFNSIKGSGEIRNGIFLTNDIKMDAVAGEMTIKGLANLNTRNVDAEVNFVPDITSGIPVLTAFAVTPQTALYVLAITTVISPVVEVFTQVNYEVKGPIDAPVVKELSRSKGEFTLPKSLKESIE